MANGPMPLDQALDLWGADFAPQVKLADYPTEDFVNLSCLKCDRKGRLRKDRLLAEHGNVGLVDLICYLRPKDCKHAGTDMNGHHPCGIAYDDLKHPRFP